MIKAFISYSHHDKEYCKELEKHLSVLKRNKKIQTWTDQKLIPGDEWNELISKEISEADLILLLISPDFLASDFCYEIEMNAAILRHTNNQARVIPIFIRFCDWNGTPFTKLQSLPSGGKPVKDWADIDKAFLNVVEGIKKALDSIDSDCKYPDSDFHHSLEDIIREIRKKFLTTKSQKDLQKLLFELKELQKEYPSVYDIENLKGDIINAIHFNDLSINSPSIEIRNMIKYWRYMSISNLWIIVAALLVLSFTFYLIVIYVT